MTSLILTILGPDRPGLVENIANIVEQHGGNWLESRMAKLSGHFAGILRIEVSSEHREALEKELSQLNQDGLKISLAIENAESPPTGSPLSIEIVGNDEPGIVKRITSTIAKHHSNVIELETSLESAPMSGHLLFRISGTVTLSEPQNRSALITALENLGPDLAVTIGE